MNKSFVEWVGGKQKSLDILNKHFPNNLDGYTYIEPFVGGDSVLFNVIERYPTIKRFVVNDINKNLINCYKQIRDSHTELIRILNQIFTEYNNYEDKEKFYYDTRTIFNHQVDCLKIGEAAMFIFLNRTCFRGLYRVNSKGKFNASYGHYGHVPHILDANRETIEYLSKLLQKVEFMSDDYRAVYQYIVPDKTFVFIDPPYRPLNGGKSVQYDKSVWEDKQQIELSDWIDDICHEGSLFMATNTDCEFIRKLYDLFEFDSFDIKYGIEKSNTDIEKSREIIIKNYRV